MATQQTTGRPWFRLASIARQPAPQAPTAEPAPPQPRPPLARPPLRPLPRASPEPTPPPTASPQPPAPRAPAAPTAPTPSVPTAPAPRALALSSSLPASPVPAASTVVLPVTTTSSVPSFPKPRVSAPTSSVPSSPATKAATVSSSLPTSATPKPVYSKPSSPTPKTAGTTPTTVKPIAEPESKSPPEAEQKDVLMQKTIEKANGDTHKTSIGHTGKQGVSKEADTKGKAHRKKFSASDTEEEGIRVITIAGENKGAVMEVIKSPKKNGFEGLYKKGNPGGTSSDSGSEFGSYSSSGSGEEGNRNMKKDKKNRAMSMNSTPSRAFMNSNVQGVNNSIVFKSSCTHNDAGVHLALSRNPSNGSFHVEDRHNGYNN